MTVVPVDEQKKAAYTKPEMTGQQLVLDDVFLMVIGQPLPCSASQTGETFGLDDF